LTFKLKDIARVFKQNSVPLTIICRFFEKIDPLFKGEIPVSDCCSLLSEFYFHTKQPQSSTLELKLICRSLFKQPLLTVEEFFRRSKIGGDRLLSRVDMADEFLRLFGIPKFISGMIFEYVRDVYGSGIQATHTRHLFQYLTD